MRLKYFFQTLHDNSNLRYGREMEAIAIEKFKNVTGHFFKTEVVFLK